MTDEQLLEFRIQGYMKRKNLKCIPKYSDMKSLYGDPFVELVEKLGGWYAVKRRLSLVRNNNIIINSEYEDNIFAFWTCVLSKEELTVDKALTIHGLRKNKVSGCVC